MTRVIAILMIGALFLGIGIGGCTTTAAIPSPYANHTIVPPVLHVDSEDQTGSAVPIAQNGDILWLLTVRHLLFPQTVGGFQVLDVERHPTLDLALLKVKGTSPLIPMTDRIPRAGERLRAIGWNIDKCLAMTDGRARAHDGFLGPEFSCMTCPILFGASGGAVLNDDGELVGIIKGLLSWKFHHELSTAGTTLPVPWLSYYLPIGQARDWIAHVTKEEGEG